LKGDPVAIIAYPLDHFIASSGLISHKLVGLDKARIIGLSVNEHINSIIY